MCGTSKKTAKPEEISSACSDAPISPVAEVPQAADSGLPESAGRPAGSNDRWTVAAVCLFLAAITFAVFGQTIHHEFVNYDDNDYVCENPEVAPGLTLPGIVWAFTHFYSANWHPLTWISHMLDCQLYGLRPGGHHLTNVLLHTATAILLFLVLRRMTGALWRSAFVAAVFAIHPLRAESVAWVAERKDVLSGLFFMLTLWAYARYVQSQSRVEPSPLDSGAPGGRGSNAPAAPALDPRGWTLDYYLVLIFFALGLMCKPMLVTLPFVLLLLDYWPLNLVTTVTDRGNHFPIPRRLILEKLPLFGLAAAACVVTLFAQTVALASFEHISLPVRMGNALISYVAYLRQMFWPAGLALLYPFPVGGIRISRVLLSLVLLAGICTGVVVLRRRPYFLTGWLWYLIMLVPVIGIVQVGPQARADRYTYLPQIGLYMLLTWAVSDLCAGWRQRRVVLGGIAVMVITSLSVGSFFQTAYWHDDESLWTHTLASTSDNFIAHNNLGLALVQKGKVDEAIAHYQKALQIKPNYAEAHSNLGLALVQKGEVDEAIAHYQKALQVKPNYVEAHSNLGLALVKKGDVDEGIAHYQKALQITPDFAEAQNNFGNALVQKGDVDEAINHYQKALQIKPDYAEAHYNLANALVQKGDVDEAIARYQKALQFKPDFAEAHNNLGVVVLRKGNVDEAIAHYQKALQIKPGFANAYINLGNALFQKGNVDEAISYYQMALQIKPDYADAHNNLGNVLLQKGNVDEAISHYQKAVQIKPDYADAHNNLGIALLQKGNVNEAISHYQRALQINPDYASAQNNLAWVLATCPQASLRNGNKAVELAQRANQLTGDGNPVFLGTLAAAYAEAGRFPEAVATAQRARQLAEMQSNTALVDAIGSKLKLYQAGIPFHFP